MPPKKNTTDSSGPQDWMLALLIEEARHAGEPEEVARQRAQWLRGDRGNGMPWVSPLPFPDAPSLEAPKEEAKEKEEDVRSIFDLMDMIDEPGS